MNYWIFDCIQDCYVAKFKSQKDVILYIAQQNGGYDKWRDCWYCDPYKTIGTAINMNGNDKRLCVDFHGNDFMQVRPFMVVDDNDRIIDIREWDFEKILANSDSVDRKKQKRKRFKSNHKRCYGHYRTPKRYQILKDFADKNVAKFMRAKVKNRVPDSYWVDAWANGSKSWKDQSKKKKQWM